ncbi:hypothetical protein [Thauera propionica]|uniref:hypothetical protein n=1 Tax=Thauera propionica TaxID=2019431 RepID=UPI0023F2A4EC|nr:hypothetical protein [Thauera propionica]MDD3676891.1 hypothetical protein [Thauera propionica]
MKPPRTLIREAVRDRLAAQLPSVDSRITANRISIHRTTPLFAGKLPAILIYTRDERIEDQPNADPGLRYRKLELSVEIIASGEAAAEEADVLAQAVEALLDADETLGLMVEGTRLTRTEVDQGGEGDTPVLAVRLSFEVSYWTRPVEATEGGLPLQVLVSWAPEIGIPHEPDYQPLLDPTGITP